MARTFEEIRALAVGLQARRTPVLQYMQDIKRHYEADWVVPMPDVKGEPNMAQFTPSLITDTIDGIGMRAASISPMTFCPAVGNSRTASARALTRRKIINATYHDQRWKVKRRRYYRHLTAYDTASVFVEPDFKTGRVRLNVRDPLFTYPEPVSADQVRAPEYVAFITRHSGEYIRSRFPQVREENGGPIAAAQGEKEWDLLEWVDHEQMLFGLLGPRELDGRHISSKWRQAGVANDGDISSGPWMQLGPAIPNRAGVCLAVTPQEISLHSVGTRLNALLGNVQMQSKLMALEVLAQQKAIFPDMFVISNPNETPAILGGQWEDGRTGKMNMLQGVNNVGQVSQTPDVRTQAMIDRLERNTRVSGGLNPQMGGESFGSLRTGRALDSMMASSVDPRIQELHEVTEAWMPHVNAAILACYKGYFEKAKYEFFSGWDGDKGMVKFTPGEDIESFENTVEYSIPGADTVQQTQVLGSLLGAEVISTETFRTQHPYIDDPEQEHTRIVQEQLHKAMLAGVQEQVASAQMPIAVVAKLYDKIMQGQDLPTALTEIDEEIKEQQAQAQAEAEQQQAQMGGPDPLAQLGLAAGPMAAAPGAGPPGAGPPPLAPGGPQVDMAAMLQNALGGQ